MKVLVLQAHPKTSASVAQRALKAAAEGIAGVTTHDLYAAYPEFNINAAREQELLLEHDVLVLQHPFYWYSAPAIVKEWLDITLEHGWAYGTGGDKLHGKSLLTAITTGGSQSRYHPKGANRFTIEQLLAPFNQTAHLCGMAYLQPFVVFEGRRLTPVILAEEARRYRNLLEDLASGRTHPKKLLIPGFAPPEGFTRRHGT